MRQPVSNESVKKGSEYSKGNNDEHRKESGANEGKHGTRTSPGQSPTQSKDDASEEVSFNTYILRREPDLLSAKSFYVETFYHLHQNDSNQDRRTYDPIHVKGLELEHFVDPKPGSSL